MSKPVSAGPWKEGRVGGASLCYLPLPTSAMEEVAKHHAAVGIRATLACASAEGDLFRTLAGRNWDLALLAPPVDVTLSQALSLLDTRTTRGWVGAETTFPVVERPALYQLSTRPGTVSGPEPDLARALPSLVAEPTPEATMAAIEEVVIQGAWGIWRIDATTLDRWTPAGHERLLRWLGDHHARIWCAPVRDIGTWKRQRRP